VPSLPLRFNSMADPPSGVRAFKPLVLDIPDGIRTVYPLGTSSF
jgi:hypothetical protein